MRIRIQLVLCSVVLGSLHSVLYSQQTGRTSNQPLISPEVGADRRITFRISAPKASEVTVTGDWFQTARQAALTRDANGVWSVTLGPLDPDFYIYGFNVDGLRVLDPMNLDVKVGTHTNFNIVFVPGPEAAFEEDRAVPHGEVREVWFQSTTFNVRRRMHVYTPPGYDTGSARYPVLYLMHGGGDDDSAWSGIGRARVVIDNLLAEQKAQPMIVVMPDKNRPRRDLRRPPGGIITPVDQFRDELLKDILPYVEKTYRAAASREQRAIAGLSVGGYQTLEMLARDIDTFAYFGIWSAPVESRTVEEFPAQHAEFLSSADQINRAVKLISFSVGEKDPGMASAQAMARLLKEKGIQIEEHTSPGAHDWHSWRRYLYEFAPRLFRSTGKRPGA